MPTEETRYVVALAKTRKDVIKRLAAEKISLEEALAKAYDAGTMAGARIIQKTFNQFMEVYLRQATEHELKRRKEGDDPTI